MKTATRTGGDDETMGWKSGLRCYDTTAESGSLDIHLVEHPSSARSYEVYGMKLASRRCLRDEQMDTMIPWMRLHLIPSEESKKRRITNPYSIT